MPQNGQRYADSKEYEVRMDFLTQLGDDNWACCGRCQRLHPRKESLPRKPKKHGPHKRPCEAWAGIVDLCPFISLTLRDRARLDRIFGSVTKRETEIELGCQGHIIELDKKYLLHECTSYPGIEMEL